MKDRFKLKQKTIIYHLIKRKIIKMHINLNKI